MLALLQQAQKAPFQFTSADVFALSPIFALAIGAFIVLIADLFMKSGSSRFRTVHGLALVSLVVSIFLTLAQLDRVLFIPQGQVTSSLSRDFGASLSGMWRFGAFNILGSLLAQVLTLLTILMSGSWFQKEDEDWRGEYHALLLFFPIGITLMISASNLMLAFVGLEIFSVALYVLCGIRRARIQSVEASLKYFLLGAFGAAIFAYGAALLYAGKGSLHLLPMISASSAGYTGPQGLAAIGGALLFVALFFKASVLPFQMWTPDVYEGAPTPITALMSTGTKAGAFLLMLRVIQYFPMQLFWVLAIVTVATIVVGNAGALMQSNLKRLFAYSGIAHAGYLLVGYCALVAGTTPEISYAAPRAILYYLIAYGLTNLAAFAVLSYLERQDEGILTFEGLKGLGRRNPWCAAALSIAALSLAGIPPTVGFWAKYQVFSAAIQANLTLLAVIGILGSVIGLYYYLKILVLLYFHEAADEARIPAHGLGAGIAMGLCSAAVLVLGIVPGFLMDFVSNLKIGF